MGFMNPPYATGIAGGTEFPPSPNERDCFYRTDLNEFYIYDGANWVPWRTRGHTIVVAASNSLDPTLADPAYRCDGVADEVQINAAIAALPAAGRSVVLLEGTYTIAGTILINRDDVMLVGSGHGTLIQLSANVNMIQVGDGASTRTNVIIKDLQVDGSAATGTPPPKIHGIFFSGAEGKLITRSRVEGCYVHGNSYDGIHLYRSDDCMVVRNRVESVGRDGIHIHKSNQNQVALNDCNAHESGIHVDIGVGVGPSKRNIIANNKCYTSHDGIRVSLGSYNMVVGNYCGDNTATGIKVHKTSYRNIVVGNYCEHNEGGIHLGTGIEVSGGSTYNMVDGNYCEANVTGIEISANNNYVVDNYLRNNTNPLTDTGTGTIIDGNQGNVGRYQTADYGAAWGGWPVGITGTPANGTRCVFWNTATATGRLGCYANGAWHYVDLT